MNIDKLIGNTPMIKINYEYEGKKKSVYTKLEYYNLTGSIKDRMAYYILKLAKEKGLLKEEQPIIEATSGNTGISFAALGAMYHHPVHIFMPDWVSSERKKIMELYGATIHLVSKEEGGFKKAIEEADKLALEINGFRPNQFTNEDNIYAHYFSTAREIVNKVPNIEAFVSGIGTGGTLIGNAKRLKEYNSNIKIYALEPDTLPLLTTGDNTGSHMIEGIGDDFIPAIVDKDLIDKVILINDEDAINMARKLAKHLGLGVGISSGANFLASVLTPEENVATVFVDDNKKYLSTNLAKEIDHNENFLSNKINLIDFEVIE